MAKIDEPETGKHSSSTTFVVFNTATGIATTSRRPRRVPSLMFPCMFLCTFLFLFFFFFF